VDVTGPVTQAGIDQAVGLVRPHHAPHLARLFPRDGEGGVEPEDGERAVPGKKFAYLRQGLAFEVFRKVLVRSARGSLGKSQSLLQLMP
jgi:hypothetical protein